MWTLPRPSILKMHCHQQRHQSYCRSHSLCKTCSRRRQWQGARDLSTDTGTDANCCHCRHHLLGSHAPTLTATPKPLLPPPPPPRLMPSVSSAVAVVECLCALHPTLTPMPTPTPPRPSLLHLEFLVAGGVGGSGGQVGQMLVSSALTLARTQDDDAAAAAAIILSNLLQPSSLVAEDRSCAAGVLGTDSWRAGVLGRHSSH